MKMITHLPGNMHQY